MKSLAVKAKTMGFKKAIACWFSCMVLLVLYFAGDSAVTNMRGSVTAADGRTPTSGDYMVIDLSGGTGASSYPVTYLTAAPSGGWTDEYKTTKLVMRKIPKGTFMMGSPSGELGRKSNETQHTVTLTKDFYIGVFEVTQRQWELVMGDRPSYFNNATCYATRPVEQVSYYDIREDPANSDDPDAEWPSNSVVNADSFMGRLRSKTGLAGFDLPTESQWEYACRAGTTTALNTGYDLTSTESDPRMDVAGRYYGNSGARQDRRYWKILNTLMFWRKGGEHGFRIPRNKGKGYAAANAGTYLPNAWGLYDLHGNVWEWCLDWYDTYPGTVTDPLGSASGSARVRRGGGWGHSAYFCRSACRGIDFPFERNCSIGFRVARTLP